MKLFRFLTKRLQPHERYFDELLGELVWSKDYEGWTGKFGSFRFVICCDGGTTPCVRLLSCARTILLDTTMLNTSLVGMAEAAKVEFPTLAAEIKDLTIEILSFFTHQGECRLLVSFCGGSAGRTWRAEFRDVQPEGMGFDT